MRRVIIPGSKPWNRFPKLALGFIPVVAMPILNKNQYECLKSFRKNQLKIGQECVCRIKVALLLRAFFK
jgi:hypothetical protein